MHRPRGPCVITTTAALEIFRARGQARVSSSSDMPLVPREASSTALALKFGVSVKAVRDIWNLRTWTSVTRHLWTAADVDKFARKQLCTSCRGAKLASIDEACSACRLRTATLVDEISSCIAASQGKASPDGASGTATPAAARAPHRLPPDRVNAGVAGDEVGFSVPQVPLLPQVPPKAKACILPRNASAAAAGMHGDSGKGDHAAGGGKGSPPPVNASDVLWRYSWLGIASGPISHSFRQAPATPHSALDCPPAQGAAGREGLPFKSYSAAIAAPAAPAHRAPAEPRASGSSCGIFNRVGVEECVTRESAGGCGGGGGDSAAGEKYSENWCEKVNYSCD